MTPKATRDTTQPTQSLVRPLAYLVAKEWLELLRDWHALLLLFAMPTLFITVMSLALRDRFAADQGLAVNFHLLNQDDSPSARVVEERIRAEGSFRELPADAPEAELLARVGKDQIHFLVVIPSGFGAHIDGAEPLPVRVTAGPGVEPAVLLLFETSVAGAATRAYTDAALAGMDRPASGAAAATERGAKVDLDAAKKLVVRCVPDGRGEAAVRPSSVQQNVPAWLVFSMFFIAIPLSTTWVQERRQGTFGRLRAMGVARWWLLLGKLVPYFVINLVQVVLMLAVGIYVVPRLGGGTLTLGDAPLALAVIAVSVSFASVSYALLIANLVSTSEQATIFTGVSNLLLAAIGGIMVPRFVMPPAMQSFSLYSPMAWGLEGFLDVFLRHGGMQEVGRRALPLLAFGAVALSLAAVRMGRTHGK